MTDVRKQVEGPPHEHDPELVAALKRTEQIIAAMREQQRLARGDSARLEWAQRRARGGAKQDAVEG